MFANCTIITLIQTGLNLRGAPIWYISHTPKIYRECTASSAKPKRRQYQTTSPKDETSCPFARCCLSVSSSSVPLSPFFTTSTWVICFICLCMFMSMGLANKYLVDSSFVPSMLWPDTCCGENLKVELEREQAKNPELKQLLKVFGGGFLFFSWKNGCVWRQKIWILTEFEGCWCWEQVKREWKMERLD